MPSISLAAWLDSPTADLSASDPQRLIIAAQFSWTRDSIPPEPSESSQPLAPPQRALQIIQLVKAHQNGAMPDAATARALWQLGSFMAATGYQAEAWDCLGQAAAVYDQLARSLIPELVSSSFAGSGQTQQSYYTYRAAALAALAEAAAVDDHLPACAKCSALLAGEIQAKLDQLRRNMPQPAVRSQGPPDILSTSHHALQILEELAQAKAYSQPRVRFWWWYYPLEVSAEQPSTALRAYRRPGRTSTRTLRPGQRPRLAYAEPQQRGALRNLPRSTPRGPTQNIQPSLMDTPAAKYGL